MQKLTSILILILFSCLLSAQQPGGVSTSNSATSVVTNTDNKKKKKYLELEFSLKGGFYDEPLSIELFSPGAKIYYTTDGRTPSRSSNVYKHPIEITSTTVVRAIAKRGRDKSRTKSQTYFINEPASTIPTISIGVSPSVLFDPEYGLYVKGPNANDSIWKLEGANFWSRKEVKVNTELFDQYGESEFSSLTGFRLFGGMSRLFPQKSMTLVTRNRYGKKRIKHRIFGKNGLKSFKFLVLRNSGSDWGRSHFRDGLITSLLDDWDIEKQDFQPAHLYLNGQYWGIYNIREKVNRYFLADHFDLDKDSIDLIEHRITLKRGSTRHYRKMLRFLEKNSLENPENYAYLKSQMDVDNFMQYQIAQIYIDNRDAGGNIKFWRPQTPDGRWRWILYDTDWGFGLHSSKAFKYNTLAFHTDPDGPSWPNPPWSTFILRKLLENPEFKAQFVTRFADHINTTFATGRVEAKINEFYKTLLPEIPRHFKRWNLKEKNWNLHVNIMRTFARERPNYMRMHLMEKFDTGSLIDFEAQATEGGEILINDLISVKEEVFKGQYFENYPVTIKAVPQFGYRFAGWEGINLNQSLEATLNLDKDQIYRIKAVFEPYNHPLAGMVMINEICNNNKKSGDWIELYNYTKDPVRLKGWYFTDTRHFFKLPDVVIGGRDYITICQDLEKFKQEYPEQFHAVGNFGFGLDKKRETLGLYTADGASIDSFSYDLSPLDSVYSLSLMLPYLDNGDIENWEIKFGKGSPSKANPFYLESRIKAEQEIWVRSGIGIGFLLSCLLFLRIRKSTKPRVIRTRQTGHKNDFPSTP